MKRSNTFITTLKYIDKKLLIYFLIVSLIYSMYGIKFTLHNFTPNSVTIGDVFLFLFGGIKNDSKSIISYTNWFGFILLIYYPIIYFLTNQLDKRKTFIFYRTEKYKKWYYSNLVISFLKIFIFLVLIYAITFIISLHYIGWSNTTTPNKFNDLKSDMQTIAIIFRLFLLNIMLITSMILANLSLLFITKKNNYSVIITIIITYLTSFANNSIIGKYLIGNVAMLNRNQNFNLGNINILFSYSIKFFLVIIIVNFIICNLLYKRSIKI